MAPTPLNSRELLDEQGEALQLELLAGGAGSERPLWEAGEEVQTLLGPLNPIHPSRIQLLGQAELEYLTGLGRNSQHDLLQQIFDGPCRLIITSSDSQNIPETLRQGAEKRALPLLRSKLSLERLLELLRHRLGRHLAERRVLHGVMLEVMGIGVLIAGPSGIGKSELALELITRGQRLIADDAPEFMRTSPDTLLGRCPPLLQDFLEVRGLGLLDIRAMFGDNAICREKSLKLIIELHPQEATDSPSERLGLERPHRTLLDVEVPSVRLPVAAGRDLAVLVEAAARRQILYYNGYDAAQAFIDRQRRQLLDPSE